MPDPDHKYTSEELLDSRELAQRIGLKKKYAHKTVERWAREGKIRGHPIGFGARRHNWRFLLSQVREDLGLDH